MADLLTERVTRHTAGRSCCRLRDAFVKDVCIKMRKNFLCCRNTVNFLPWTLPGTAILVRNAHLTFRSEVKYLLRGDNISRKIANPIRVRHIQRKLYETSEVIFRDKLENITSPDLKTAAAVSFGTTAPLPRTPS